LYWKKKGGRRMDVFEKVKKILCDQLDLEEEQVTEEAEVIEDLGADSLDIVDLVMTLEEEFDTEIPDEDIENLKTVGDIVKYIEDHAA
jgi:acyl carrier protein